MPKAADPENRVRRVVERIDQMAMRLTGGPGRLLWNRVLILQTRTTDLSVGLYLACAGGLVEMVAPEPPDWDPEHDPAFYDRLLEHVRSTEPRLLTKPLEDLGPHCVSERWGFRFIETTEADWDDRVDPGAEIILVDGIEEIFHDPVTFLTRIHRVGAEGCLVELAAGNDESISAHDFDRLCDAALRVGFGIRFHLLRRPDLDSSSHDAPPMLLGLVRLAEPLSDHPVTDDPTLMSHTDARLDVAAQLVRDADVLDAGGWAGLGAERFLKAGASSVVTLDISSDALEQGRKRFRDDQRARFRHWDLNVTPYPFDDESFDVIVCLETLEHITEHAAAISEFQRLLRPGGYLLISIPDREFESEWAAINRFENPFHIHVPSREDIGRCLEGFGQVRWLRQVDVAGSFIAEEGRRKRTWTGRYEFTPNWKPQSTRPQVIMALAQKMNRSRANADHRESSVSKAAISSHLRVHNNAGSLQMPSLNRQRELEVEATQARYEWWSKCNALEQTIESLTEALQAMETRTEREMQSLRSECGESQTTVTRLQAQLEAARTELTEAQEQYKTTLSDLKREHEHLIGTIAELKREKELAQQALEEAVSRQDERTEIMARLDRVMDRTIAEVERRCLNVEARMYDLEDQPLHAGSDGSARE